MSDKGAEAENGRKAAECGDEAEWAQVLITVLKEIRQELVLMRQREEGPTYPRLM